MRGLSDEEYVYFFFREQAVEYINCGKVSEGTRGQGMVLASVADGGEPIRKHSETTDGMTRQDCPASSLVSSLRLPVVAIKKQATSRHIGDKRGRGGREVKCPGPAGLVPLSLAFIHHFLPVLFVAGRLLARGAHLQVGPRRPQQVQAQLDLVPQVQAQLLAARRVPILLRSPP